jgi:DnaJ-domain-containing protein 1
MNSSSSNDNLIRIPVRIEMLDGERLEVSLISPRALLKLFELLNREEKFLDVEAEDGERLIIAKTGIKTVKTRVIPKNRPLGDLVANKDGFDPYGVLKIEKGSPPEAIRDAYLALAREYQPERFAGMNLPKEVTDYLAGMLGRITAAYDALSAAA